MVFNNINEECNKYLKSLFTMQEENIDYILAIRKYLENPKSFPNKEKEFFKSKQVYAEEICKYINIDNPKLKKRFKNSFNFVNLDYFSQNPFYSKIKNIKFSYQDWKLETKKIDAYEAFVFNDLYAQGDSCYITSRLSFYNKEYYYPSISLYGREWMSLHPNEICTMETPISACKGKVLVLGLGIGYFAYMASQKNNVSEVHIVEMDKDVIKIFEEKILPIFDHPEKIHIHKADAFKYIENVGDGIYNYIFSDLWHDTSDGMSLYISLFKYFHSFKFTHCYYWIEDSILATYRLYVIGVIRDFYNNYKANDYDDIQKDIYDSLLNLEVTSKEEISKLLTVGGLKNIIIHNK